MIKVLACIFMLIDHLGLIFFSDTIVLRLIGRLAMPFFSFCLARGFKVSYEKGTLDQYKKRMTIFSIVSQIPYMIMVEKLSLNIGFLWIICLVVLEKLEKDNKIISDYLIIFVLLIITIVIPIDYGIYGVGFTLMLYYFQIKQNSQIKLFISFSILHILSLSNFSYGIIQIFTLPSLPMLDILEKYDNNIKLNRVFFYCFYPVHISILLMIKYLFF